MAITNKLITFNKLTSFETQLAQGNILETSIVFIKDAKKIWTKGTYFDCSGGGSSNIAIYETTDDVYNGVLNDTTYELSSILRNENIHTVIIIQKMEVNTTTNVRTFVFNACDRREPRITTTFTCLYSEADVRGNTTNLIFYQIAKTEGAGIKLNKQPIALKSDIPNTDDFVTKSGGTIEGHLVLGGGMLMTDGDSAIQFDVFDNKLGIADAYGGRHIAFDYFGDGTKFLSDDGSYKTPSGEENVQSDWNVTDTTSDAYIKNKPTIPSAVTESTVSGWGFTKNAGTITGVSANGTSVATSGVANIPAASTSKYGVTKLSSSTSSTSTSLAATASAVKSAYDLANGRQAKLVSGTNIKTINGESILGAGDITIESGGDSIPNVTFPNFTSGTLDESESEKFSYVPEIFIAICRISQFEFKYLLFKLVSTSTSKEVYRYISYAEDYVCYSLELDKTSKKYYTITQTELALKSEIPNSDDFPQYDNQQAITVQGINNGNGSTYAIPGSDIADGGEYVDTFALKSEIPDTSSFAKASDMQEAQSRILLLQNDMSKKQNRFKINGRTINLDEDIEVAELDLGGNGRYAMADGLVDAEDNYYSLPSNPDNYGDANILATKADVNAKQDKLVSGTTIATINNNSILGSGNFDLATSSQLRDYQPKLVSGTSIKTINGESILGSGNIVISGGSVPVVTLQSGYIDSLQPNVVTITNKSLTALYIIDFVTSSSNHDEYTIIFSTGAVEPAGPSITLPDYVLWANGSIPTLEWHTVYELSITRDFLTIVPQGTLNLVEQSVYKAVLTPFKSV